MTTGSEPSIFDGHEDHTLFGRSDEYTALAQCLDAALAGQGSLALIAGEAGVGKSSLARAIVEAADERGAWTATGRAFDLSITPPFGPWQDILVADGPTLDPGAPVIPEFGLEESEPLAAAALRTAVMSRVTSQPSVILLDDAHWMDEASLDFLRQLARELPRLPLLVLVTYRSEHIQRGDPLYHLIPYLVREAPVQRINLHGLSRNAIESWLESTYGLDSVQRRRLAAYLLDRTSGSPLFVEELLRSLGEQSLLTSTDNGWQIGDLDGAEVPAFIRQLIDNRLAVIDDELRYLLEVAAVVGPHVPLDLWLAMTEAPPQTLDAAVAQGYQTGLLDDAGQDGALHFRHEVTREALYAGLAPLTRIGLHQRAGETLLDRAGADPESLAYHFDRAGDPRAAEWLQRAGDRCYQAGAYVEASERFREALAHVAARGDDPGAEGWLRLKIARSLRDSTSRPALGYLDEAERNARAANDETLLALVRWTRGVNRPRAGENGLDDLEAALPVISALDEDERARVYSQLGFDTDSAEGIISVHLSAFGRYRDALARADRFIAREDRSPTQHTWFGLGTAHLARAVSLAMLGDPASARGAFADSRAAFERFEPNVVSLAVPVVQMVSETYVYAIADPEERRLRFAECEELWALYSGQTTALPPRFGLLPSLFVDGAWDEVLELATSQARPGMVFPYLALTMAARIAHARGDTAAVRRHIQDGLPDGVETEPGAIPAAWAIILFTLGAALAVESKELEDARIWTNALKRWLDWTETVPGRAEHQLLLGHIHLIEGALDQAREAGEEALRLATQPEQPLAIVGALRFLARVDLREARAVTAAERLTQALELVERCGSPYERAQTLLVQAEFLAATGMLDEAEAALAEVVYTIGALKTTPLQRYIDRINEALVQAGDGTLGAEPEAILTDRETEVLRLVADGMTDIEVGEQLFISHRTVGHHLRSIYGKLEVNSRAAAVSTALRQKLI